MRHAYLLPFLLASCAVHAASASFTAASQLQCNTGGKPEASWSGACKDGLAVGPGVAEWKDDRGEPRRLQGTLAAGDIAGSADLMLGRVSYSGTFRHFVPDGDGFFKFPDGAMYEGGVRDGKPNGRGVLQEADRSRYEGDWVAGMREGRGSATYALGGSYDGQWRNNNYDGLGTIVYAGSGRTFTGQFVDGRVAGTPVPVAAANVMRQIRGDTRSLGSTITDTVGESTVSGGPWADLSESERQAYQRQYKALEAGDEPPYPAKGLRPLAILVKKVHDAFPDYKGPVRVLVLVDTDGKAASVTTVGNVPADVTKYVSGALFLTPYKPAICHGAPCRMPYSVAFVLK